MLFYATARAHGAPCFEFPILSAEELDRAFDLQHHLRWTGEIIDRALRDGGN
jgi:hypothetical protein